MKQNRTSGSILSRKTTISTLGLELAMGKYPHQFIESSLAIRRSVTNALNNHIVNPQGKI